jgi:atrial natriuretic peptide receptor A
VVKLTDFGLESLRGEEGEEQQKGHAFWKRRLWTAPELISLQYSPRYILYSKYGGLS